MTPWHVLVLVVGLFLGPFYEALRKWLNLGGAACAQKLPLPARRPELAPQPARKARKR